MSEIEFVQATGRLERYFDKEYLPEQIKEMFRFFKDWNKEKYIKAIDYCLRNSKFLPKIADLMNADIDTAQVKNKEKINFVKCNKCNGEGFIKYWKTVQDGGRKLKYEYIALCTCENAKRQREVNKYNFPTLAEVGLG